MKEDISFDAEGTILRGWFFKPHGTTPAPVIVLAHGYAGVKEQGLEEFGAAFAEAGFAVLAYDHRNFGASDGLPRQEVDPVAQIRDYRHAISYAQTRPEVDPKRVGIWGSSYSGGHVLVVGAIDRRVGCVVSMAPTISGHQSGMRRVSGEALPGLLAAFEADRAARFRGEPPVMIPMASEDEAGKSGYGADTRAFLESTREAAPAWRNEITLRSVEMSREYEPGIYVSRISPTPLLMVVAAQDQITPMDLALDAYERALEPKKLLMVKGGHYAVYREAFERTSAAACAFYWEHLGL